MQCVQAILDCIKRVKAEYHIPPFSGLHFLSRTRLFEYIDVMSCCDIIEKCDLMVTAIMNEIGQVRGCLIIGVLMMSNDEFLLRYDIRIHPLHTI